MSNAYVGGGNGGGGGGGVTSVEGTAPIQVNGVSGVPQTGAVVVSDTAGPDLHVARFIVSPGGGTDGANYSDLPTAYAAAVAATGNQTIFLQPGTYNIGTMALSPNIGLTAYDCDGVIPNVIINGKLTANFTGICAFSGIFFVNDTDNILAITGSGASQIRFIDCWIQVGGTAFAITNSNNSCSVSFETCQGDISGTSAYFDFTAGGVNINNSFFFNSVESSTTNNFTTSSIGIQSSVFDSPIVNSGLGGVSLVNTTMICLNDTCITTGGATNSDLVVYNCHIDSNNATAITIGAGGTMTIANTSVGSNATDAISGAGTLRYSPIAFTKSSSTVSTSGQSPIRFGPQISPELTDTNGTVYYDGTIIETVPPGTAGDIYTSNGAGSPPSFQPPSGGGITEFFSVYLSAPTGNVTGDNTLYGPILFDGIITNTSGSYNAGTGNYTIPSDGEYCFQQTIVMVGGDALTQEYLALWGGSGYSIRAFQLFPTAQAGANTTILSASISSHFTAGQTVNVQALVGGTNKNIAIYGAAPSGLSTSTVFSGFKFA